MYTGRIYNIKKTVYWTRKWLLLFAILATVPVVLYEVFGFQMIIIPWLPVSLIGIAVAFYVGFKNNSSYNRLWEARTIWGGIVNESRSWAVMVINLVSNQFANEPGSEAELKQIKHDLVFRHIGWLTTLRYQLRADRTWEHHSRQSENFRNTNACSERRQPLQYALQGFLSEDEIEWALTKKNPSTHLLNRQAEMLKILRTRGLINDFQHMEMQRSVNTLLDLQGKCERIKNYPFPRQYATVNIMVVWIFIILLPFGMIEEFRQLGEGFVWLAIPFTTLVAWVFHTMEMIGDYSENPFEGLWNDVPITSLCRTIEIDLKELLQEDKIPEPFQPVDEILL